jgi:hypothetical protein
MRGTVPSGDRRHAEIMRVCAKRELEVLPSGGRARAGDGPHAVTEAAVAQPGCPALLPDHHAERLHQEKRCALPVGTFQNEAVGCTISASSDPTMQVPVDFCLVKCKWWNKYRGTAAYRLLAPPLLHWYGCCRVQSIPQEIPDDAQGG